MNETRFIREALGRHERELVAYALRLTGDLDRARDVVQDTFLELCERPRAEVEPKLAAWLFTVCRNRALDARKKEGRMGPITDDRGTRSTGTDPARRLEEEDTSTRILHELGELPEREREVLRLKFHNGFAYREIADITGLSVANVGYLMHCGLKTLRSRLAPLRRMEVGS